MICPDCGTDNMQGVDNCEECGQDLRSLDVPLPKDGMQQILLESTLAEVGMHPPNIVAPSDSALDAVRMMQKTRHGSVLVVENGKLVGIFTERDVLDRLAGESVELDKIPVGVVMTRKPQALKEEDVLAYAVHKMAVGHYRHIPILRDGHPIGFVSIRGVLKFLTDRLA